MHGEEIPYKIRVFNISSVIHFNISLLDCGAKRDKLINHKENEAIFFCCYLKAALISIIGLEKNESPKVTC